MSKAAKSYFSAFIYLFIYFWKFVYCNLSSLIFIEFLNLELNLLKFTLNNLHLLSALVSRCYKFQNYPSASSESFNYIVRTLEMGTKTIF